MRRAAISVPSNIAEGKGRHSPKEFLQFLYRARGSLLELVNEMEIARELEYLDSSSFEQARNDGRGIGENLKRFDQPLPRRS